MAGGGNISDWVGAIFGIPKTNYSASLTAMKTERTPISERSFVPEILTKEHRIQSTSDPLVQLHLRERRAFNTSDHPVPLLLIHGATISSVLWDNPLPGWSWMDRLAMDGFHVFAVDLRGYGRSSRPESFNHPPLENAPYARVRDVEQDVIDTIEFIKNHTGSSQIDLLGGSWGSIICGKLVAENQKINVRRLILYAPLYSETTTRPDWLGRPPISQTASIGAYRRVSSQQLKHRWDEEIPVQNKSLWRPDGIFESLASSCIEYDKDPGGQGRETQSEFLVPNGTIADLYEVFDGKPLYDSGGISIPTLLIRGSADPISTHEDAFRLFESLKSDTKRYTVIGNGAHFMIAEHKIKEVHSAITGFLAEAL